MKVGPKMMMIIIIIGASSKLQKASNQSALSRYAN
jgi:hypothetical protein